MAGFKFGLETLLNHRLHHEETIQKELAVCEHRLRDEKSVLNQMLLDKNKAIQEIHQKQLQGIIISEHVVYANFLEGMDRNLTIQNEKINESEKKFVEKRDELIEAVKKRKTLEKLKEKGFAAYSRNMLKLEQEFMDEVAISHFNKETL